MKLVYGGRASGKSAAILEQSSNTGKYILVPTVQRARELANQAEELGFTIPFPVTPDELRGMYSKSKMKGVLVDDVLEVLKSIMGSDFGYLDVGTIRTEDMMPLDEYVKECKEEHEAMYDIERGGEVCNKKFFYPT